MEPVASECQRTLYFVHCWPWTCRWYRASHSNAQCISTEDIGTHLGVGIRREAKQTSKKHLRNFCLRVSEWLSEDALDFMYSENQAAFEAPASKAGYGDRHSILLPKFCAV